MKERAACDAVLQHSTSSSFEFSRQKVLVIVEVDADTDNADATTAAVGRCRHRLLLTSHSSHLVHRA